MGEMFNTHIYAARVTHSDLESCFFSYTKKALGLRKGRDSRLFAAQTAYRYIHVSDVRFC